MLGLCLPQIQRLANTWHLLRQKHTDEAFNFEAKLRPTLRAMNECTNPQAPNTTLPHLLPIALLGERSPEDVLGMLREKIIVIYCEEKSAKKISELIDNISFHSFSSIFFSILLLSIIVPFSFRFSRIVLHFHRHCNALRTRSSRSFTVGELGVWLRPIDRLVASRGCTQAGRESTAFSQKRGNRPRRLQERRTAVGRLSHRVPHQISVGQPRIHRRPGGTSSQIHPSSGRDVRQMRD